MFRSAVTAVALVLMIPQVTLAEWMPVIENEGDTVSVRSESLERHGDIVTFWSRTTSATFNQGIAEAHTHTSVNCRRSVEQRHFAIAYNEQGERVMQGRIDDSKPRRIKPGTVGEAVMEFVCQ